LRCHIDLSLGPPQIRVGGDVQATVGIGGLTNSDLDGLQPPQPSLSHMSIHVLFCLSVIAGLYVLQLDAGGYGCCLSSVGLSNWQLQLPVLGSQWFFIHVVSSSILLWIRETHNELSRQRWH